MFLDTHGLVALLSADDWLHEQAVSVFEEIGRLGRKVMTTDLVLAELGNGLSRSRARSRVEQFIRSLLAGPRAVVVFADRELLTRAVDRYSRVADKQWGLVDCVSFEIMDRHDVYQAFTTDHHFEQAGFHRLLGQP